jgi:hypothetical protein
MSSDTKGQPFLMNGRMWAVVLFSALLFFIAVVGLFLNYRHTSQVEVQTLKTQLDRDLSLADDKRLNAKDRSELENQYLLKKDWQGQIWGLMGTETFKTITVSLLLAVILAVIGGVFKIDNAIEEKIRAEKQKRIDSQTKCIEKTADMWNELYCIVSEVRYYDIARVKKLQNSENSNNKARTITDILMSLQDFDNKAEDVVNTWQYTFPQLPEIGYELIQEKKIEYKKEWEFVNNHNKMPRELREKISNQSIVGKYVASELIILFVNVLLKATYSVAYIIQKKERVQLGQKQENLEDKNEEMDVQTIQNSLGIIQEVIKAGAHQGILNLLKNAIEPIDKTNHENKGEGTRDNVKTQLIHLYNNARKIRYFEYDYFQKRCFPFSLETGDACNEFQNKATEYVVRYNSLKNYKPDNTLSKKELEEKKIQDKKKKESEIDSNQEQLETSFRKMFDKTQTNIIGAWDLKYPADYLKNLANFLAFRETRWYLEDKADWLEIREYEITQKSK